MEWRHLWQRGIRRHSADEPNAFFGLTGTVGLSAAYARRAALVEDRSWLETRRLCEAAVEVQSRKCR